MKSIITLFLFVVWLSASSQSHVVSGQVKSAGKPVAGAIVMIKSVKAAESADANGYFELKNIPSGRHLVSVSMMGYERLEYWIKVDSLLKPLSIDLVELRNSLNEVTISGTLTEKTRLASPVPVEVYSAKFFQKVPSSGLFESIRQINGVMPTVNCNVCNTGDIHINGMDGPYTLVLIDGMPMVSALSSVYGLMGIPSGLIEKVEVVKGPAATLYGSEAVGGLINVITRNPNTAPRLSLNYFVSGYGESNLDLATHFKAGKVNGLVSGNWFEFNNRVDVNQDNFTDVTLQNRVSVFTKLAVLRRSGLESVMAFRLFYEDRFGGEMNWQPRFRGGDSIYGESIFTRRFEWMLRHPFKLAGKEFKWMSSVVGHDQNSVYGTTRFNATQWNLFNQVIYNFKSGNRHSILSGIAAKTVVYDDNTPVTASTDGYSNNTLTTFLPGIFVQDEWALSDSKILLVGSRIDYHSTHGLIYSPRLNFKWTAGKNSVLRFTGGNGFRVVNLFTEEHAALTGARRVVVEQQLKPEKSWNFNAQYSGWFNRKGGYVECDFSLFYTYFKNKIVPDFDSDPNTIFYRNLSYHAVSRGITLNIESALTTGWRFTGGITLMDVFTIMADSLGRKYKSIQLHAPGFSGTWQVSRNFAGIRLLVDFTGQVYGPMRLPVLPDDFRPAWSPWYTLQDLQVTKKLKRQTEIYIAVKNIWNFMPANPIMRWFDPFDKKANDPVSNPKGYTFDPGYNYAPMQTRRLVIGVRFVLN